MNARQRRAARRLTQRNTERCPNCTNGYVTRFGADEEDEFCPRCQSSGFIDRRDRFGLTIRGEVVRLRRSA